METLEVMSIRKPILLFKSPTLDTKLKHTMAQKLRRKLDPSHGTSLSNGLARDLIFGPFKSRQLRIPHLFFEVQKVVIGAVYRIAAASPLLSLARSPSPPF